MLIVAGFGAFVEGGVPAVLRRGHGALSLPQGRYCRMHLVGYFEAIESERGRGADSLSLRDCAGLGLRDRVFAGALNNRPCADWWGANASAWTPRP